EGTRIVSGNATLFQSCYRYGITGIGDDFVKLNEIRTFVTVARTGSIQAAARQLNMTQSAVSRLVQRLELDLGATLFDRQSKPLALTHDGRVALEYGQRVLHAAEAFSEALSPAALPSGVLRIGAAHVLAELVAERPL